MQLGLIFFIGGLVRFLVPTFIKDIPFSLSSFVEIGTPTTSFRALKEAFYYFQHDIDLYDGGINYQPPLLVVLLNLIDENLSETANLVAFNLLFTAIDLVIAWRFISINKWYVERQQKRYGTDKAGASVETIASCYLFNPLLVLTNVAHSTLGFTLLAVTESLYQITVRKNLAKSIFAIAIAAYLSYSPIYLVIPLLGIAYALREDVKGILVEGLSTLVAALGSLLLSSYCIVSSWSFVNQCYGTVFFFKNIAPNLGLWWYLFIEMFEFFTPFYIGVFNIYSVVFIIPITLRLYEKPGLKLSLHGDAFLAFVACYFWISFTKPYATIGDLGFGLSLIPILKSPILAHCKLMIITALTLLISLLLSPIFYYCWIILGNGNSNFFYSISLLWGAVHGLILGDLLWAKFTLDYTYSVTGSVDPVPSLRLTQI